MSDSISDSIGTIGRITVGSSVTGDVETANDRDAYAVELVAGRTYRIDLEGVATDKGTLANPFLRWLRDDTGTGVAGTRDDNGGEGDNARQTFTPTESGTYYISARGLGDGVGTYTLTVTDATPVTDTTTIMPVTDTTTSTDATPVTDATRAGATDLGDITALQGPRFPQGTLDGDADQVDYYRFTLTEAKQVGLGLRRQDANADLFLEDADGTVLYRSTNDGTANEAITETLLAGTYYVRVESQEAGENAHVVRYGVSAPDANAVAALQQQSGTTVNAAPAFGKQGYAFDLAENADGSTDRVSLGTVAATDPEGTTLAYSLVGGNLSGSFELDATSGELFYIGSGEDFETGLNRFILTVWASDGSATTETTVTVNVTDVNETPAFAETSYAFDLAENADGSTDRVSLGTIAATDPEGTTLAYSLAGGNESGSFEVDATSGELFYKGSGEDFESGTTQFTLTVRASDGSETADTTVTVDITDVDDTPAIRVADAEATEGDDTEMVFRVTLDNASTGTVTVNYATTDGTATAGEDYTATSGTLTFAPGETEKTVSVTIIDDTVEDSGETFTLALSDPSGGTLGDTEATGTIFNTEPPPARTSVSEADGEDLPADTTTTGEVAVGGSATGNVATSGDRDWFKVELVKGCTYTIDLRGSTTDLRGMAAGGTLYDPNLYGIHDAGGNRIAGTTNDDGGIRLNSRVTFTATESGTHYIAAGASSARNSRDDQGTYTVEVTEKPPSIRVANARVTAGDDTEMVFRVTMKSASSETVTVNYTTADGTAVAGDDYTATSGTLTFAPGETEKTVAVTIIDDTVEDPWETFRLVLSDPSGGRLGAQLGNTTATGTIFTTIAPDRTPVSEPAGEDFSANTSTSGRAVAGETVTGNIGNPSDRDWFAVDLVAGRTYTIDLRGGASADGTLNDPILRGIRDPDGNRIPYTVINDGGKGNNSRLSFTAGESGTHYIVAGGFDGYYGTYELEVTEKAPALRVANERAYERDDSEMVFRVYLENRSVGVGQGTVTVDYATADGTATAGADYTATSGTLTFAWWETAKTVAVPIIHDEVQEDGGETFTLVLSNPSGVALEVTEVVGTIGDSRDDYTADTDTTGTIAVGGTAGSVINFVGDRDWFAVELVAGNKYRIDVEGWDTGKSWNFDPRLHGIYDSAGNFIPGTYDDNSGIVDNARKIFVPTQSGTHYISAGSGWLRAQDLLVLVHDVTTDDYSADRSNTGTVAAGGSTTGHIETGSDQDWFAVELAAGTSYWLRLDGWVTDGGTISLPRIAGVHDSDGNLIAGTADDVWFRWREDSLVFFTAPAAGTYYIAAESSGPRGQRGYHADDLGTYTLSVTEAEADDFSADTMTTGAVTVGGTAEGNIEAAGDRDWFGVNLVAGTSYLIDLKGNRTNDGTLADPRLAGIHDASGDLVSGTMDDNDGHRLNARVRFTPDTTGKYYIAADESSYLGERGGTYTLSVAEDAL